MKAMAIRATVAAAIIVAGILGAAPAGADGATVINAHCDDRLVTQPTEIIPNCADQRTTLTGLRWISWSGEVATGFGNRTGPKGSGPVMVTLDHPAVQMTGQNAFTHAVVASLGGAQEQFAIAPMWAQ